MLETKKNYEEAIAILNKAAYAYYTLDNPIMSDSQYDDLYFKVKAYEDKTGHIDPVSPTQRVGDKILEGFNKAKHLKKMYSLDDVFSEDEFLEWAHKIQKEFPNAIFYQEPKYDGLSLNLQYEDGKLIRAITRGNGEIGEDVTANVSYIKGIPLAILEKSKVEVRGEVVLFKEDFEAVNADRVKSGKSEFSNERNAASGILRSFDSIQVKNGRLRFTPYSLGEHSMNFTSQRDEYEWFLEQGFVNWNEDFGLCHVSRNPEDLVEDYYKIIENRNSYKMLLDGMVVKVDQKHLQEELGFTSKFPKWAIAFKFPAEELRTTLENVVFQVGKTGAITPVGIVSPVEIDGVRVTRVTLHNFEEIERMDLRIGDTVGIIRSGDVIPKITGVYVSERRGNETPIEEPNLCPVCASPTERREINDSEMSAVLYCSNANCPAVLKGRVEYAVGKKALDIASFGEAAVDELIDKDFLTKLSDIFRLDLEMLLQLEGFKEKKAKKLLNAIEGCVGIEAHRVLNAIDIPNIGESASKKLIRAFGERIFSGKISKEELLSVEDIGETAADSIIEFFSNIENMIEVDTLLEILDPQYPEKQNTSGKLTGKTFVITGTLSKPRKYFQDIIEENLGKVSGSVSKKTDYLLAGEEAGSKLEKAVKLGVEVLDEEKFFSLI